VTHTEALARLETFRGMNEAFTARFRERDAAIRDAKKAGATITEIARAAGVTAVPVYRALRGDQS
jgi:transposase-like protein